MNILIGILILVNFVTCGYDRRVITTLKYSKIYVTPTVVNGEPARQGDVPYIVSIKESTYQIAGGKRIWRNLCGGSIISRLRVLTAAHCFEGSNFFYAKYPQLLRVVAGNLHEDVIHSGSTETTPETQWRRIKSAILHRFFHFPNNDIALVFVDTHFTYDSKVDFIMPAASTVDYSTACLTAGYGRIGHRLNDPISPKLLLARINILSRSYCSKIWEMDMDSFVCTDSALADVSRGDSGGPLACHNTTDPKDIPGRGVLVGVVSGKNFDKTTLYTRVSEYHSWIAKNTADKIHVHFLINILLILIYSLFYWLRRAKLFESC